MSWVGSPKISFRYSVSDSSPAREMMTECQLFSAVNCGLEGVATGELRCFYHFVEIYALEMVVHVNEGEGMHQGDL